MAYVNGLFRDGLFSEGLFESGLFRSGLFNEDTPIAPPSDPYTNTALEVYTNVSGEEYTP